jgi:hypothetical protein
VTGAVGRSVARAALAAWLTVVAATACRDADSSGSDSAAASAPALRPADTAAGPDSVDAGAATEGCVAEGAWRQCSVEKRLTDAGFVPVERGAAPADVFAVPGTTYALGPATLHVYLFSTAADRERAIAGIDTVAVAPAGKPAPWGAPVTLITTNNLAAVLVSDNGRLIERAQLALTAGLPSAAR